MYPLFLAVVALQLAPRAEAPPRPNIVWFIVDDMSANFSCYGEKQISTPHVDALAARGTRFSQASTPCPICVPARASLATGRYGHEIGYWDNADAYEGGVPSWHHVLRERGHRVVSIGKLHFRGHPATTMAFPKSASPCTSTKAWATCWP